MASTPQAEPGAPRHLLVFEPDYEGHSREWLQHLLRHSAATASPHRLTLVVAPELRRALAEEAAPLERVQLLELTPGEQRLCRHRSLSVSGIARWWVIRRYLRRTGAEAGHVLSLDLLTLPLAFGLGADGRRLSGILFRPSVHYRAMSPHRPRLAERVREIRKAALYRLMLLNRALRVVLTLDPYFPAYARRYRNGGKVRAVPDPVHPAVNIAAEDALLAARLPQGRVCFLLFGYLDRRKGVLVLLEALRLLPPAIAARTAVMMAGRIDPAIGALVEASRRALATAQPSLQLEIENRRLRVGEVAALIERCDVVLAPYQRFVGSSGVLLWAARAGKPLLTQDYGLVGRLVRDHRLGIAAEATDAAELARAMARLVESGGAGAIDRRAADAFVAPRTAQQFASQVFASLLEA
jgi:glycosyltransferase involved in cell wall biosynthesis